MPSTAPVQLAVIGSGPAGCFFAQSLLRSSPATKITVFDRLPSPFGLVRYGVAADHQHTKAITRQFERLFADERVSFAGNIAIGRDLSLHELREHYDAVILATGLSADRPLDIPGSELSGVHGAGVITRVLNSHPDEHVKLPQLGDDVVIIGGGNVAIDLVRFLVKGRDDYLGSDIADNALAGYLAHPARRITLINRSRPAQAKSDPVMLKELVTLARAKYLAPDLSSFDPVDGDRVATARLAALDALTAADRGPYPGPEVVLRFGTMPVRVFGESRVEGVEIAVDNRLEMIPASSVLTAIGFHGDNSDIAALRLDYSEVGKIEPGLYRTGWAKRGPVGAIPENRADAKHVADEVAADIANGVLVASGRSGFASLPKTLIAQSVSYDDWQRLEQYERSIAPAGRVRRKLTSTDEMLAAARTAQLDERNLTP